MLMVDLRKAYDTISWEFLEAVLRGLGFPVIFVSWIMECVRTATYSISISGELHGFFRGKRGLRQEDPMSPTLFLFCIEYFSRLCRRQSRSSGFFFHPWCAQLRVTHLAFADDLLLFSRADKLSVDILMGCLRDLERVSGLAVNPSKSWIFLAGVSEAVRQRLIDQVGFQVSGFQTPVRYLGIPLNPHRLAVAEFSPLINVITDYISKWNHLTLSFAGRLELIASVIQGVEAFWLHAYPVPKTVFTQITNLCNGFLWGGKQAKVRWEEVCVPKEEGGLGLKDLRTWNVALLSRAVWNLHRNAETLWVQWVHGIYLRGVSIWDYDRRRDDSMLMRELCTVRDSLIDVFGGRDQAIAGLESCCVGEKSRSGLIYDRLRTPRPKRPWMSCIWRDFIPPKYSFIVWLTCRDRLATKDRLTFMPLDDFRCCFCRLTQETRRHLFFACPFTGAVWRGVRRWLGVRRDMSTVESCIKWIKKDYGGRSTTARAVRLAFCCTIYMIWLARNTLVFDHEESTIDSIITKVKLATYRVLYRIYPHSRLEI